MHHHKVSILIPVYNREKYIADCIQSALDQTYSNIEIIIVDNASTDRTWDICLDCAAKDDRVRLFQNEKNIGPVRNWKRCIEEASGDYGKILWSDDLIAPDFLEETLPLFNDDVGFVYSGVKTFTESPRSGDPCYFLDGTGIYPINKYIEGVLYKTDFPVSPGCAVFRLQDLKRNLLINVPNKVNSDFAVHAIGNDLLLFLLTAKDYKKFAVVAKPLSFFRAHNESISVVAKRGKLPLHYALAKAYFVNRYLADEKTRLASYIQLLLWRNFDAKKYGMRKVEDFFEQPVKLSNRFLIILTLQKAVRLGEQFRKKIWRSFSLVQKGGKRMQHFL